MQHDPQNFEDFDYALEVTTTEEFIRKDPNYMVLLLMIILGLFAIAVSLALFFPEWLQGALSSTSS